MDEIELDELIWYNHIYLKAKYQRLIVIDRYLSAQPGFNITREQLMGRVCNVLDLNNYGDATFFEDLSTMRELFSDLNPNYTIVSQNNYYSYNPGNIRIPIFRPINEEEENI